jgi:hypothetical protein
MMALIDASYDFSMSESLANLKTSPGDGSKLFKDSSHTIQIREAFDVSTG